MGEHRYAYLGSVVASEVVLDELPGADPAKPVRWRFRPGSVAPSTLPRLHEEPGVDVDDEDEFLRVHGDGTGRLHLDFPGRARFDVDAEGTIVGTAVDEATGGAAFRHVLLDHVLPRLEGQAGRVVVHASAVLGPGGAIVMLGASGGGKSTLAACLARAGWPLLTDDAVALDPASGGAAVEVLGAYPGVRLWPEGLALAGLPPTAGTPVSPAGKRRLGAGAAGVPTESGPHPLAGIVLLSAEDGGGAGDGVVPAADVFEELHRYRFVVDPAAVPLRDAFEVVATAAARPARRLTVSDRPTAVEAVRSWFGTAGGTGGG